MCDKPLCTQRQPSGQSLNGQRAACVGTPVETCTDGCNGHGACRGGRCACYPHRSGASCERHVPFNCINDCSGRGECDAGWCRCTPPYYGVDCSLAPLPVASSPPASSLSPYHLGAIQGRAEATPCTPPCVYVYELPPRMNVLAMKAEPHWGE